MGPPFSYDQLNIVDSSLVPGALHMENNLTFAYFVRYLYNKLSAQFVWKLPEGWNQDYFLAVLYGAGYITIFDTEEYGTIPQWSTLTGYTLFYQPREAIITNPVFEQTYQRTIGEDCTVLHLMPDYTGAYDIICQYAAKMAAIFADIDINLINTRLAYVFTAKNKAAAQSFKKMFDSIASGEPAVFIDKNLLPDDSNKNWQAFQQDLRSCYLVTDYLADLQKLECRFNTLAGIPNANTDKRERLISDEVRANDISTAILGARWLESLKRGCEEANAMFGLNISVNWRFPPNESNTVDLGTMDK